MKIGIIQSNPIIGDFSGNQGRLLAGYNSAVAQGADIVVAPELALWGYPPKDLLLLDERVAEHDEELRNIATSVGKVPLVLGVTVRNTRAGKPLYNSAVWLQNGGVRFTQHKTLLPTYDIFDERRYFEPNRDGVKTIQYGNNKYAILVCEDVWGGDEYLADPLREATSSGADILIVVNASPFHAGKAHDRLNLFSSAKEKFKTIVYVNQVGGQDELVFDGGSFVLEGEDTYNVPNFQEGVFVIDTDSVNTRPKQAPVEQDLFEALVMGVRDYFHKQGFSKALLGLSGGIDSAVVAVIANEALGSKNVLGVAMPSEFSSGDSLKDARELAQNLGIEFTVVPISELYTTMGETLKPVIGWEEDGVSVTEENVQARMRGQILMAISNRTGGLVLATGNKSELAVGYCTLYGDMAGGFAVISDVLKSDVFALARWINREEEIIPWSTITKPPSAELSPGQVDSQSLPPYDVLDPILRAIVQEKKGLAEIVQGGFDREIVKQVISMVERNEYKRRQAPVGLRVTSKAFGFGRRMPIVYKK